jgi:hypothetical protein
VRASLLSCPGRGPQGFRLRLIGTHDHAQGEQRFQQLPTLLAAEGLFYV